jgi:hypothetical protein
MIPPAPIITFLREILIWRSSPLPDFPRRHDLTEAFMSSCSVRFELFFEKPKLLSAVIQTRKINLVSVISGGLSRAFK